MTVNAENTRVNYSYRNNGGTILLPEWSGEDLINLRVPSEQELFDDSTTQLYPIGAQLRKGDNLWRYCKAGAAMTQQGFLKGNYIQCPGKAGNSAASGFEGAMYAAVAANATSFTIADTGAAKNLYEGAILVIYDDTNLMYQQYRVLGNDVSTGVFTTLYIGEPGFAKAVTTGFGITIYLNPYIGIRTVADSSYMSALGYARFSVASGSFFWLVTAGPVSCVTGASTWPGQTARYRDVYCNTDGSLIGYNAGYQKVGYLLSRTAADYGDNLVMLQLDQ